MPRSKKADRERDINRSATAGPETGFQASMPDCHHIAVGLNKLGHADVVKQLLAPLNLRARRIMAIKPKKMEA